MAGRPSSYNEDTAQEICERVALGENLHQICQDSDMPGERTVYQWLKAHEEFAQMYARARTMRADKRSDRIDAIARKVLTGEYDPAAARVAIDAEKWQASKEAPRVYGDKLDLSHSGSMTLQHKRIERVVIQPDREPKGDK
jgi:hypothetical protein